MLTACEDDLPNPHKDCIRGLLNALICHDNDVRRINIEIRNLQTEFKKEMDRIKLRCGELRKPQCRDSQTTQITEFAHQIASIDELNEAYGGRIESLKTQRENILANARQGLLDLAQEKCKMKLFHEKTVDYLKRLAINSNEPKQIENCENDICQMHKLFVKEVAYVKECENELQTFIEICDLPDNTNCCCFKEYDWLPMGKNLGVINEITDGIKGCMGPTLMKAFAQVHLYKPTDVKSFLAAYLLNLDRNEEVLKEKLRLFENLST